MSIANTLSAWNRRRKWELFLGDIAPKPEHTVLDVGFSNLEYSPTDNYIEKHYSYPERIVALGIEPSNQFELRYPSVRAVQYDGVVFPFRDKEFDICWSNAVIEHVGGAREQLALLREIKRTAKRMFITTPNRNFPVEVHTRTLLLHLLPKRMFDAHLRAVRKDWAAGTYMHLLRERDLRKLLEQAGISDYHLVKNRLLGFTMDFVIVANLD